MNQLQELPELHRRQYGYSTEDIRARSAIGAGTRRQKALTADNVKILTIFDILGMTESDIDTLEYDYDVDGDGKTMERHESTMRWLPIKEIYMLKIRLV